MHSGSATMLLAKTSAAASGGDLADKSQPLVWIYEPIGCGISRQQICASSPRHIFTSHHRIPSLIAQSVVFLSTVASGSVTVSRSLTRARMNEAAFTLLLLLLLMRKMG